MSNKPICKYDGKCYRKNPDHFKEYDHPVQFATTNIDDTTDIDLNDRIYDFYNKNRSGVIQENKKITSKELCKFFEVTWKNFTEAEQNNYKGGVEKLSEKFKKENENIPEGERVEIQCGCTTKTSICDNCFEKYKLYFNENEEVILSHLLIENVTFDKWSHQRTKEPNLTGLAEEESNVSMYVAQLFKKYKYFKQFELCKFSYKQIFQMDIDNNQISNSSYFFISGSLSKLPLISVKNTFINYPLTEKVYSALKSYASKSPFGLKEKTLFDENVRKSYEIDSKEITVSNDFDLTNSGEYEVLEIIRKQLAPNSKQISAELYKMVLYEKGSHFSVHKDTLRKKNHFATLIFFVPSKYEGGQFTLVHNKVEKEFDFSVQKNELSFNWLAFYTDCDHSIKELKSGNRITLTYNLYHDEEELFDFKGLNTPMIYDSIYQTICDLLKIDQNLYFMLSHHYSKSSLKPEYLKGRDLEFYLWLATKFVIELEESIDMTITVIYDTEIPNIEDHGIRFPVKNLMIVHPFIESNLPRCYYGGNIGTTGNFGCEELFLQYQCCGVKIIKKL